MHTTQIKSDDGERTARVIHDGNSICPVHERPNLTRWERLRTTKGTPMNLAKEDLDRICQAVREHCKYDMIGHDFEMFMSAWREKLHAGACNLAASRRARPELNSEHLAAFVQAAVAHWSNTLSDVHRGWRPPYDLTSDEWDDLEYIARNCGIRGMTERRAYFELVAEYRAGNLPILHPDTAQLIIDMIGSQVDAVPRSDPTYYRRIDACGTLHRIARWRQPK